MISKEETPAGPVFDYFPYGKQKEEVVTPEKITQTFTGKEFDLFEQDTTSGDDGEGWYYFGARYYDADIGKWISTDPAMEFHDAYRYTTNPIGFIDPNGLAELRFAFFMKQYDANVAAQFQAYYGQFVKEGDNLKIQAFTPETKSDMLNFLVEGDKSALGAHGGFGEMAVFYGSGENMISFQDLNNKMSLNDKTLYIDACFADENLSVGAGQIDAFPNVKAADGASGIVDVGKAGARSLGIEVPNEKK